jgi:hypothetical protein
MWNSGNQEAEEQDYSSSIQNARAAQAGGYVFSRFPEFPI